MENSDNDQLTIASRYLEDSHHLGVERSLEAVESLFPGLGFQPNGPEHVYLIFLDYEIRLEKGETLTIKDLLKRYPGCAEQLQALEQLDDSLSSLQDINQQSMQKAVNQHGWHVLNVIKKSAKKMVCLASCPRLAGKYVLKVVLGRPEILGLQQEYKLLSGMPNKLFLHTMGMKIWGDIGWIVLEHAPLGTMADAQKPSLGQLLAWWQQCAEGLAWLHHHYLCHNDVKASNIFLSPLRPNFSKAMLGDLRLATREGRVVKRESDLWDPPNVGKPVHARKENDIYRLAMTVAWVFAPQIIDESMRGPGKRLSCLDELPQMLQQPLRMCLQENSINRIQDGHHLLQVLTS